MEHVDAIVVGAGQAGLATSYFLSQARIRHTVLERGVVGDTWINQRWDSFAVNTPNWSNALPDAADEGPEPGGFYLRDELVASFQHYARSNRLPVRENTTVTGVGLPGDGRPSRFMVETTGGEFATDAVFVCSGIMSRPRIPGMGSRLPSQLGPGNPGVRLPRNWSWPGGRHTSLRARSAERSGATEVATSWSGGGTWGFWRSASKNLKTRQ